MNGAPVPVRKFLGHLFAAVCRVWDEAFLPRVHDEVQAFEWHLAERTHLSIDGSAKMPVVRCESERKECARKRANEKVWGRLHPSCSAVSPHRRHGSKQPESVAPLA